MKLHLSLLASIAALLASPASANDLIIGNLSSGIDPGTAFGGSALAQYKAFGFTMGSTPYTLDEVILSFDVTGAAISPLVEIWSDAGGSPGNPLFALENPGSFAGQGDFTFSVSSPHTLMALTSYWLHLKSVPMDGDAFTWDASSPATLPTGVASTALTYEFNGAASGLYNRLEIRGTAIEFGTGYCRANVNSTGQPGLLAGSGSLLTADNFVRLTASQMPASAFGFFLVSRTQGFVANPGGSQGSLCLVGSIGRYDGSGQVQQSDASGSFALHIDILAIPQPNGTFAAFPGETWNFQAWYRDGVNGSATSNFSNGLQLDFL
ncbi:hypothetical protein Poly30_23230 [Planctomycetes bacterium Poly30]|uniref:Uncharacterized protein n=1 Tax=Saltatorellus ferox TaxID=2528018 RepID=A0A518ERT4_9BACT|nr:hypothetical protein Poly30_23230 [Planctomycetes bacterium Poly30]